MQFTTEMIKLMNNLIKKFLKPKEIRATAITTLTPISKIYQFAINNRLGHSNQLEIAMKIIQTVCNGKTNKIDEKIIKAQKNQGDSNNNTNNKRQKFVSFPSTINLIILINL